MTERRERQASKFWQELEEKLIETGELFEGYPTLSQLERLIKEEETVELFESLYIPVKLGTSFSDFGEVHIFHLEQIPPYQHLAPKDPAFINLKYGTQDNQLKTETFAWRRFSPPSSMLFQLVGRLNDRVVHLVQVVRPNTYLETGDHPADRGRDQSIIAHATYSTFGLAAFELRIGYVENENCRITYKPNEPFGLEGYPVFGRTEFKIPQRVRLLLWSKTSII